MIELKGIKKMEMKIDYEIFWMDKKTYEVYDGNFHKTIATIASRLYVKPQHALRILETTDSDNHLTIDNEEVWIERN